MPRDGDSYVLSDIIFLDRDSLRRVQCAEKSMVRRGHSRGDGGKRQRYGLCVYGVPRLCCRCAVGHSNHA